jgi:2-polyprenyl-6-methoxyphenol hydroxylase-like FAD-dependent oxidoreductase
MSFQKQVDGSVLSRVRVDIAQHEYYIRFQYLFGCDGARSQVLRQAGLPLIKKPCKGWR